jgi:hypothetical protein
VPKRGILKFALAAAAITSAVGLTSLYATGASAATSHSTAARTVHGRAATAPHAKGVLRLIHRGLVKDCEYIENYDLGTEIEGNGVDKTVSLTSPPGNCFDLYNSESYKVNGVTYTGYEYQNGDGHCLWLNTSSLHLELGVACQPGDGDELFFGVPGSYAEYGGWEVYAAAETFDYMVCGPGDEVSVEPLTDLLTCDLWNFPSG